MEEEIVAAPLLAERRLEYSDGNVAETSSENNSQSTPKQKPFPKKDKNSKQSRKESKGSKPMSSKRSSKSLIHMTFNREHSIFEVTRKCKTYLQVMGVPLKTGGHILFPEEVLYLMELWTAYATDEGQLLTLYDGIRILGETGVPFYKYRAYSALRKAGFVALRPNRSRVHNLALQKQPDRPMDASTTEARPSEACNAKYPKQLLDDFPTVRDSQWLVSSMLHRNCQLVPTEDLSDFSCNPRRFRIPPKLARNYRRPIRPAYWPDFELIASSVSSWEEYARRRRSSIKSARKNASRRRQARAQEVHSEYDFEVFLSDRFAHSFTPLPAFRVICFDSRQGALSCAYAHRFADDIPLMLSIFDCGYISFIEISGRSVDLNQYLENLLKESQ